MNVGHTRAEMVGKATYPHPSPRLYFSSVLFLVAMATAPLAEAALTLNGETVMLTKGLPYFGPVRWSLLLDRSVHYAVLECHHLLVAPIALMAWVAWLLGHTSRLLAP